jgi:DNA-binding LacI/PurR family transcriptional regulator
MRFGRQRNAIYELVGPSNVDGLVVMAGTIGNHVGPEALAAFLERFRPLPMCSVACPSPACPSVLVDNATGMREALVHHPGPPPSRTHRLHRGPEANPEAAGRYGVYCEVLAERGLPIEPALTVVGDFQQPRARRAVEVILGERGLCPDAIVAFNDDMASGRSVPCATVACASRGTSRSSALTTSMRRSSPTHPLPPCASPCASKGRARAEMVFAQLRGEAVERG